MVKIQRVLPNLDYSYLIYSTNYNTIIYLSNIKKLRYNKTYKTGICTDLSDFMNIYS